MFLPPSGKHSNLYKKVLEPRHGNVEGLENRLLISGTELEHNLREAIHKYNTTKDKLKATERWTDANTSF